MEDRQQRTGISLGTNALLGLQKRLRDLGDDRAANKYTLSKRGAQWLLALKDIALPKNVSDVVDVIAGCSQAAHSVIVAKQKGLRDSIAAIAGGLWQDMNPSFHDARPSLVAFACRAPNSTAGEGSIARDGILVVSRVDPASLQDLPGAHLLKTLEDSPLDSGSQSPRLEKAKNAGFCFIPFYSL
jgi:hypothetical protein